MKLTVAPVPTSPSARELGLADETARNHIRALLGAFDAHSRLEAVVKAIRLGLVTLAL